MGICLQFALVYYIERHGKDTNQMVVQLLDSDGHGMPHWYYRSDQYLGTTGFEPLPEYYGPIDKVPEEMKEHISESRFLIDEMATSVGNTEFNRLRDLGKIKQDPISGIYVLSG